MFNLILPFVFPLPLLLYIHVFLSISCHENISQQKGETSETKWNKRNPLSGCLTHGLAVTAGFPVDHHGPYLVLRLWSPRVVWSCKLCFQLAAASPAMDSALILPGLRGNL